MLNKLKIDNAICADSKTIADKFNDFLWILVQVLGVIVWN